MERRLLAGDAVGVLITGGSRGLGLALAEEFGRRGAKLAIAARDADELERARAALSKRLGRKASRDIFVFPADLRRPDEAEQLIQQTTAHFGRIDILVNNAGAARGDDRVPTTELSYETWKKVLVTNLDGTFLLSREVAKQLIAQGEGGSIVNISSIASKTAGANTAAYASSKAGINALSRSMALELAKNQIRVNAVCPGIIDTFRMDDIGRGERWQQTVKMIPLQRAGDGSECAEMVLFLVSRRGDWITGQAINVDGGHVWGN